MANKSYKGRKFEIWLSGVLSRWWSRGKRDDIFWHTHDSGGRATKRTKLGLGTSNLYGDICATDTTGYPLLKIFTVEAKKGYNKATVQDLLDRPNHLNPFQYEEWIVKIDREAKEARSRSWLLIHRRDKREALVLVGNGEVANLLMSNGGTYDSLVVASSVRPGDWMLQVTLSDFLRLVSPAQVRKLADNVSSAPNQEEEEE